MLNTAQGSTLKIGVKLPNKTTLKLYTGPNDSLNLDLAQADGRAKGFQNVPLPLNRYPDSHSICDLIGPPRGYVGSDAPGLLEDTLRRNPLSHLIVSEYEKGHPSVLRLFAELLQTGSFLNGRGTEVLAWDADVTFVTAKEHPELRTPSGRKPKRSQRYAVRQMVKDLLGINLKASTPITIEEISRPDMLRFDWDEFDKIGKERPQGDPLAALLKVLDSKE